jgi:hypothetical protein
MKITLNNTETFTTTFFTNDGIYETESDIYLTFDGCQKISKAIEIDNNSKLIVTVSYANDFYSTSNFSTSNAFNYGLDNANVVELEKFVKEWVQNAQEVKRASRAIPLPYFITAMGTNTREETIMRKGILQNTYADQLTEKAFWMYLIPAIIERFYPKLDLSNENVNGENWIKIDNLIRDLYTQFKATFCDSILDDNNNIVNFSMENELPVVRLNITYKYGV